MFVLFCDPFEIIHDAIIDLMRFALAVARYEPCEGIVFVLRIITSRVIGKYTFSRVAHRDHVGGDCTRIIRSRVSNSYPMIYCDYVPEIGQASADGTASLEVLPCDHLLLRGKSRWQIAFTGATNVMCRAKFFWMRFCVLTSTLGYFFYIRVCVSRLFVFIAKIILFAPRLSLLNSSVSVFLSLFGVLFSVLTIPFSVLFSVRAAIFSALCVSLFYMFIIISFRVGSLACSTLRVQSILRTFVFSEDRGCCQENLLTLGTTLKWIGLINHRRLSLVWPYIRRGGHACKGSGFHPIHEVGLVHTAHHYTANSGVCL